jgi:hypothetical protein
LIAGVVTSERDLHVFLLTQPSITERPA